MGIKYALILFNQLFLFIVFLIVNKELKYICVFGLEFGLVNSITYDGYKEWVNNVVYMLAIGCVNDIIFPIWPIYFIVKYLEAI